MINTTPVSKHSESTSLPTAAVRERSILQSGKIMQGGVVIWWYTII